MGSYHIAVLAGDGIGPEVTAEAARVLLAVGDRFGHTFVLTEALVGQATLRTEGTTVSDETLDLCRRCDAALFGASGTLDQARPQGQLKPESAILRLRKALHLFANLRPVTAIPSISDISPLRADRVHGVDVMLLRELTGGIYYGQPGGITSNADGATATDTMIYGEAEIERVVRLAFRLARGRRKHVTSVDKANVLHCSRLWRQVAERVARDFPDVELRHMLVDACAMELIRRPTAFDVLVTENLFGDILSDEAAMLTGSIGMQPSASLGDHRTPHGVFGLYEPIHGSAPDIAGKGIANPIGAILSAALLLRHSLSLEIESSAVERAVGAVLGSGARTADLAREGETFLTTSATGAFIAAEVLDGPRFA